MNRTTRLFIVFVAVAVLAVRAPAGSGAVTPSVTLGSTSARVGERVLVTLRDWPARSSVVIYLCGNMAKRGTRDCNLEHGTGLGLSDAASLHIAELAVVAPPSPCPCVVRVANAVQSTIVYAPIDLPQLPTAPVVGDTYAQPLVLSASAQRVTGGFFGALRSRLGGRTSYAFTVRIHNRSAEDYAGVRVRAHAGRGGDDQARLITVPAPGTIVGGQTWEHTQHVTLSAPVVGTFRWDVSASGAGPVLKTRVVTNDVPALLYLLLALLIADVAWIATRRVRRGLDHRDREGVAIASDRTRPRGVKARVVHGRGSV